MEPALWILVALALPFFALPAAPLLHRWRAHASGFLGAGVAAASFLLLGALWVVEGPQTLTLPWMPSVGIALAFRLDALAFLFALLVTGIGGVIFAYSAEYMAHERGGPAFYAYLLLFMGSMLGLVLADDLILLFVFWELTTISSFFLIGLRRETPASAAAALKALLTTGLGGLALLIALLAMAAVADSFALGEVVAAGLSLQASPLFLPILLLFAVAVATKSAQVPLHTWLPDAMVAPTPVSAYLHSAAMVKAGIYLLARFLPALAAPAWETLFLPLGLLTLVVGGLLAVRAVELKRILAYSTISQLGLLVAAFGTAGITGQEGGLLHVVNHAVLKASLFLVAGGVTYATGRTDLRELGGLRTRMPLTAAACGLAVLSLAGIPPLGGFLSKEVAFEAFLETGQFYVLVLAVVGSGLTVAYGWNFFARLFLGPTRTEGRESPLLAVPTLGLALFTLVFGFAPGVVAGTVGNAILAPVAVTFAPSLLAFDTGAALMSVASVVLGLLILVRYGALREVLDRTTRGLGRATPEAIYDTFLTGTVGVCRRAARALQNGSLHRYAGTLVLAVALILVLPLTGLSLPPTPWVDLSALSDLRGVALVILLLAMVAFASLAALLRETLPAVLSLSGMGFLLAMTFMILHAPDLALTQVLVETVTLVIFLVVLYRLPVRVRETPERRGAWDALLALGVFGGVTYLVDRVLDALSPSDSVAQFYLDPLRLAQTGGENLVNVIVTDFRAFDTLGEITVIALAALAVITLLRRWRS